MKNVARLFILAAVAAAIPFAACGGETPTPNVPGVDMDAAAAVPSALPSATPSAAVSAAPSASVVASATASAPPAAPDWKAMNKDQRTEHMKKVVMPKMSAIFQGADAKKYADFSCVVCHGPDAKQGKFDMPNPKLPKLTVGDHKKPFAKHKPEAVKFMGEKVVPAMAEALGMQPFNPETMTGFGCAGCHVITDMKKPDAKPADAKPADAKPEPKKDPGKK